MAQTFYRRFYSAGATYRLIVDALRSLPDLANARRSGSISSDLIERIMLAVTEVNGCEVCSYVHTRIALSQGISAEAIAELLAGDDRSVPAVEHVALLFAQHYAESGGRPSEAAWQRLISTYGTGPAHAMLAAARVMMFANANGIALSAFRRRLLGNSVARSSLLFELTVGFLILFTIPFAALESLIARARRLPLLQFSPD